MAPAVQLHVLPVVLGGVAAAVVCGVALDDSAANMLDYILHKGRAQEILIAGLAGVQLHGDIALKLNDKHIKRSDRTRRAQISCEIYFVLFHIASPLHLIYLPII